MLMFQHPVSDYVSQSGLLLTSASRFIMSCTQLQSFQQFLNFQHFQFQRLMQFQHFQNHQRMKIEHHHRSTWTTRSTCRTWPAGERPPTPTRNEVRHKDFGTEEYNTSQLQTEETTHTKQEKHDDFCIEGFNTDRLQTEKTTHTNQPKTEKTTRAKHDQQAKNEDFSAEEFNTLCSWIKGEKTDPTLKENLLAKALRSVGATDADENFMKLARDTG